MTSGRLLARNTALNLFGQVAPLLIAVIAVPQLISALGPARFGMLTLAWALIGYFGLFDFGIGRALTQMASEAIGLGDENRLRHVSSVALAAMFVLSCVGAAIIAAITPWLCFRVLNMPNELRAEAATSFLLLAASLPFVMCTVGLRGLMEAHQHFGMATALRVPYSLFNFVGPLLILPFSHSLVPIVATLVAGRALTLFAHVWAAVRCYPWLRNGSIKGVPSALPLFKLGGWITVSNVVSPVMVYMDRFVIGALLSMSAVAFYVTPYEVVSKLLFVPGAVLGVFFPAFASSYVRDRALTATMFDRTARFILMVMFPLAAIAVGAGREGLSMWVGPEFARQSTAVLQILAAGVLINSFAQIPAGLLQAVGRADLTARAHLAELPLYVAMLFGLGRAFGLPGVAAAWSLRMLIDTGLQCWLAKKLLPEVATSIRNALASLTVMLVSLMAMAGPTATLPRLMILTVTLGCFVIFSWRWYMTPVEKSALLSWGYPWRPRSQPESGS